VVEWKKIDAGKIEAYCNEYYARYTAYPSVRDIFYHFVDKMWSNTKSVYKALSKWLVAQRLNKKIDWRIIRDGAGREYDTGDWTYKTPREHVEIWLNLFTDCGSRYDLPMWLDQPKKVIVVCEKEADYPVIKSLLSDLNVDTFYERGYSGWRPLFEAVEKIKEEGKIPIIVTLGDFDPSGEDIVRFLKDAFIQLGFKDIRVEKVCVTKEQIEKFDLPHRPEDAEEIQKLQKDPRFKKWPYGLYRVETAALRDRAPDYFDQTLKDAVMKHFDQQVYAKVKRAQEEAQRRVSDFFQDNEDLIEEFRDAMNTDQRLE